MTENADVCILISAGAEWRALAPHFPDAVFEPTPYGNTFSSIIESHNVRFLHGGWGKVAAAGSAQFAIDRWNPERIINLGTCGGFLGHVARGEIILAQRTVIYDIIEQMTDFDQGIAHYSVALDLSWLPEKLPQPVSIGTLVSADRDLLPSDIPHLVENYNASAADWESGAIAWIAQKNNLPCLILRGVSDLVNTDSGEAYGNYAFFEQACRPIMANFAQYLPAWIKAFFTTT